MHIIVGSTNKAKVQAVSHVFPDKVLHSFAAHSNVSPQPLSDAETRQGAINRALHAQQSKSNLMISIGLEGGIMQLEKDFYLCNWGAIILQTGSLFTASGTRILLPERIADKLKNGMELGDIMTQMTQDKHVRQNAGAIGILTNNVVTRQNMYTDIVKLLKGQWEFQQNQRTID